MRNNILETFKKWKLRETRVLKRDSCSTDGTILYSYNTPILRWVIPGSVAILNKTKYSKTTSSQQNNLRSLLVNHEILFQEESETDFNNWDSWNVHKA